MLGNMLLPVCDHTLAPCAIFRSSSHFQKLTIPTRLCVAPRFRLWLQQRGIRHQHHGALTRNFRNHSQQKKEKCQTFRKICRILFVCLINLPFCPPFSRLEAGKNQKGHSIGWSFSVVPLQGGPQVVINGVITPKKWSKRHGFKFSTYGFFLCFTRFTSGFFGAHPCSISSWNFYSSPILHLTSVLTEDAYPFGSQRILHVKILHEMPRCVTRCWSPLTKFQGGGSCIFAAGFHLKSNWSSGNNTVTVTSHEIHHGWLWRKSWFSLGLWKRSPII